MSKRPTIRKPFPAHVRNERLRRWVSDIATLTEPDSIYWADGSVMVGQELLLGTLDAAELGHACRTVAALAVRVAPLLETVHGVA